MSTGDVEPLGTDVRRDMRRLLGPTAFGACLVAGLAATPAFASDTVQPADLPAVTPAQAPPAADPGPQPASPGDTYVRLKQPEESPTPSSELDAVTVQAAGQPAGEAWPRVDPPPEPRRARGVSSGGWATTRVSDAGSSYSYRNRNRNRDRDRERGGERDGERTQYFDPAGLSEQEIDALLDTNGDVQTEPAAAHRSWKHDRERPRRRRHEAWPIEDLASLLPGGGAWPSVVTVRGDVRRDGLGAPAPLELPDDDGLWDDLLARTDRDARDLLEEIGPLAWPAVA